MILSIDLRRESFTQVHFSMKLDTSNMSIGFQDKHLHYFLKTVFIVGTGNKFSLVSEIDFLKKRYWESGASFDY